MLFSEPKATMPFLHKRSKEGEGGTELRRRRAEKQSTTTRRALFLVLEEPASTPDCLSKRQVQEEDPTRLEKL